jgi:hypothetical protein
LRSHARARTRLALVTVAVCIILVPLLAITVSRAVEPRPGTAGQFNTACPFSHRGPDDPIVFPGEAGKSHSHDFIGNRTTNASSTLQSLKEAGTSCDRRADRSAYWFPTLYENGVALVPHHANVYYRVGRKEPQSIRPYPQGLRIIAGDSKHQTVQPREVIHWGCHPGPPSQRDQPPSGSPHALSLAAALHQAHMRLGPARRAVKRQRRALRRLKRGGIKRGERRALRRRRAALKRKKLAYRRLLRSIASGQRELDRIVRQSNVAVPTCPAGTVLEVQIRFPDCWDGVNVDSADHQSHMAYPSWSRSEGFNVCPRSHPVPVPRLGLLVRYPTTGGPGVRLASGLGYTAHADFFNAWDEEVFAKLVRDCLNADAYCGRGSRPAHGKPAPTPAPKPPGSEPPPGENEPPPDDPAPTEPPPDDDPLPPIPLP